MKINIPNLKTDSFLPDKYTCDGENISPPLEISEIPDIDSLSLVSFTSKVPESFIIYLLEDKSHIESNAFIVLFSTVELKNTVVLSL